MKYIKTLNEKYLSDFQNKIRQGFGVELELYDHGDWLQLDKIVVTKSNRNEGEGTKAMQEICEYADSIGKDIRLTPDDNFGASSVNRLKRFYKRFDFIKNKDNKYKDSMVRYAK